MNGTRPFLFFCAALVGIAAITVFGWFLLSTLITTPTPQQVAEQYGIHRAPLKPEPVENDLFVLALLCAVPIVYAAARRSLRLSDTSREPALAPMAGLALLGAAIWIFRMDWTSIVPPHPAASVANPVREHVLAFTLYTAAFALLLVSEERLFKKVRAPYLTLALAALALGGFSRLVLMSNFDSSITSTHYEVFVYPLIQDWLGRGIYLNQKSQYGLYPVFLRPLWAVLGGPTTKTISGVMATLLFMAHAGFVAFVWRFTRYKGLAVVFALLAIGFMLLFYPFWPNDSYFEFFPIRLVFPALACALLCARKKSWQPYVAYAVLPFGCFWNFESGLAAMAMFAAFELSLAYEGTRGRFALSLWKQGGLIVAGLTWAGFVMSVYYLNRFGSAPDWSELLRHIRIFSAGVGAEPMPMWGAWIFHVAIYLGSLFVGFRALLGRRPDDREHYAALLATATLGILWLRYYQGRSMPLPLAFVSMPAILCAAFLLDIGLSRFTRYGGAVALCAKAAVGAPLLASLLLYFTNNPVPHRAWAFYNGDDTYPLDAAVNRIRSDFSRVKQRDTDETLVLTSYTHLFQAKIGKPNPLPAAGMCQIWFDDEVAAAADALRAPTTRMAVFDSSSPCGSIDGAPEISRLLGSLFTPLAGSQSCSLATATPYRAYVRRGPPAGEPGSADRWDVAFGKEASQSSTYETAGAAVAVDGNTDGRFQQRSVSHTALDNNPWWQVDLRASSTVREIVIWNRTDCCSERLNNYWVFISDTPFGPADTPATLRKRTDTWSHYEREAPCPSEEIEAGPVRGRYVRIQLPRRDYLSLAEVQVFATGHSPEKPMPAGRSAGLSPSKSGILAAQRQPAN